MVERTLTLLRHGDAMPAVPGEDDYDRPLSDRGSDDIGRLLKKCVLMDLRADWIYASPAARTQSSAQPFETAWHCASVNYPDLYLGHEDQLLERLRQTPADIAHILMVGHNPGLSYLASLLNNQQQRIELPTAALASFQITVDWVDLAYRCAELTFTLIPADY